MVRFTRPRVVVLATAGCLALAGAAYAYFSATGSGTGTATVGTQDRSHPARHVRVHGVSGDVERGELHRRQRVLGQRAGRHHPARAGQGLRRTSSTWTGSACSNSGTEATTCESVETGASDTTTANFWMADVVANQTVPTGSGQAITASGTLKMNNLASNQDACKNANLVLNLTS